MCIQSDETDNRHDEIGTSGLWSAGNCTGVRSMSGNLTTAMRDISGDGMVSLSKHTGMVNVTHMNERLQQAR